MQPEQKKDWNDRHKALTALLSKPGAHAGAVNLFLDLHAALYASGEDGAEAWNFEDELLKNISEDTMRLYPVSTPGSSNSVVWHLWHSARVEDITMNMLAADSGQVLLVQHFAASLGAKFTHSGNGMTGPEVADFSGTVDIPALLAYRRAVAVRTREIIGGLAPEAFKRRVEPERIARVAKEGAVKDSEQWLLDYWAGKTIAGLILMPATRHNLVHLNKAGRIKQKVQK